MSESTYWNRLQRRRVSRRTLLGASARAGIGAAGLALVGCGDDDDDAAAPAAAPAAAATTQPQAAQQQQQQAAQPAQQQAQQQAQQATQQEQPAAAAAPAPAPAPAADQPKTGGKIQAHWAIEESHYDPHSSTEHFSAILWRSISAGILKQENLTNAPQADIAENWENPDPLTFVFNLRDSVTWHNVAPVNGRKFIADDAVYSFERMSDTEAGLYVRSSSFASVDKFDAPDDTTFRVHMLAPSAPLMAAQSNKWSVMVAREVVEQFGDLRSGDSAIGVGPFVTDSADNVRGTRVVRNPNYFGTGLPYLDEIEWAIITDITAQEAAYIAGQTSLFGVPLSDRGRFESRDDTNLIVFQNNNFHQEVFANRNDVEPFNDLRVRKALHLALDRTDMGRAAYPGAEFQVAGMFPDQRWGLTADEVAALPGYGDKAAERQQARELLSAAGQENLKIKLLITEAYPVTNFTPFVAMVPHLAEIGVEVEFDTVEFGALKERERARDYSSLATTYAYFDDPDFALFNAYHTDGVRNYWNFHDPAYDALVERQRAELDQDKRLELVREAQYYLLDQVPVAPATFFTQALWATKKYFQNFKPGSATVHWEMAEWWRDDEA